MGKNTKIEWAHHTFNPWWGCTKVSAACTHCYAETWARRVGADIWGPRASRRFFSDAHWGSPLRWNTTARERQERQRVFCASMADVFEKRSELDEWRDRLWALIEETPWLDWLLLTKRPENVSSFVPWRNNWPSNVWLGTTVENQQWAERRLAFLIEAPAIVRFVSCEPLLGRVNLRPWMSSIHWVIAGGESGGKARPTHPGWIRKLRDDCEQSDTAFLFKQWGNWSPTKGNVPGVVRIRDGLESIAVMKRSSKHEAGRMLDGRTWNEVPHVTTRQSLAA